MRLPNFTAEQEKWNAITHGIALLLSIISFVFLVYFGLKYNDNLLLLGFVVFGLSKIAVFAASTFYHWISDESWKKRMRLIDHLAIYMLIAGTYTPFLLGNLRTTWVGYLIWVIWFFAFAGMAFKVYIRYRVDEMQKWDLLFYIGLGCCVIFFLQPAYYCIGGWGILLLALGGLSYLVGTWFFTADHIEHHHAIWHLFVIGGAFLHYFSILFFVTPPLHQ